ncbi:MAG: BatD family protein [Flavobacteriaceae bacterium]|nr:BatD family protein [Flavobacteriaceae bacterium]
MRLIIYIYIIFSSFFINAQIDFELRVSKKKLGINERLRVDFVMNQNGDDFIPPSFENFRLVGGPNQSISNSWINGKRTFSKTFTYFLEPKEKGIFKIGFAKISFEGNTYQTLPVSIEVLSATGIPSGATSVEYLADENMHLIAEISKNNPYLNEAITVVYKLYFRNPIKISDAREIQSPKFRDFWSSSIKIPQLKVQSGSYKGEVYNEVIWRKTILYPQKKGKLIIEPLALNLVIEIPTKRRDFFGNIIYKQVSRSVSAGKNTLYVKELPINNKPENFSGAVGKFSLDFLTSKKSLKALESFQSIVKVTGKGNLNLFKLPKIKVPSTLEVFEPEYKEEINTTLSGMEGSIQNTYTIVPQVQGKYPIPSIEFSYFDPEKESYQTLKSIEHIVDVYGSDFLKSNNNKNYTNTTIGLKTNTNKNFGFIKLTSKFIPINELEFWKKSTYWLIIFFPLIVLPIIVLIRKLLMSRIVDKNALKSKRRSKLAIKYMGSAKKHMGNKSKFYDSLEKALHNYLKANLQIETVDIQKEIIVDSLIKLEAKKSTIDDFMIILNNCDMARYSPMTDVKMRQDYSSAIDIIEKLDYEI